MRLSWNEIRVRAAQFAEEWKDAHYERGESQTFYNEFFEVFGVRRRKVASFEEPVKLLGDKRGFVDLFWKGVLLVEQKSAGFNLEKAKTQAFDYFPGISDQERGCKKFCVNGHREPAEVGLARRKDDQREKHR